MKKVTQMPGTQSTLTSTQLTEVLKTAWEMLPVQIEYAQILAKLRRKKYEALIAEGFTEDQALEIVKNTSPFE